VELARQFAEVHVAMHNCERPELPAQREGLIRAIVYTPNLDDTARQRVLAGLDQMAGGESVCHGDYHPGNIILSPRGPVVIDWMTAGHGNAVPTWSGPC
jgi:Ser/Thr protein kinase RdoA (MazF antagonist)